jgi:hypothetical protein
VRCQRQQGSQAIVDIVDRGRGAKALREGGLALPGREARRQRRQSHAPGRLPSNAACDIEGFA